MIVPSKHVEPRRSLIGIGTRILAELSSPKTVTTLWDDLHATRQHSLTFQQFSLSLDFLYAVGAIRLDDDRLVGWVVIHAVTASHAGFQHVQFQKGFNVVLAERKKAATSRDTRNGLGKSTLVEIIHFCLGAGARKGGPA